jgi:hypothetical protein
VEFLQIRVSYPILPADGQNLLVNNLLDKQAAYARDLLKGQVLGLGRINPKTSGDQQERKTAQKESALPLQACFTKQTLEATV